jgi:hypothetical protein
MSWDCTWQKKCFNGQFLIHSCHPSLYQTKCSNTPDCNDQSPKVSRGYCRLLVSASLGCALHIFSFFPLPCCSYSCSHLADTGEVTEATTVQAATVEVDAQIEGLKICTAHWDAIRPVCTVMVYLFVVIFVNILAVVWEMVVGVRHVVSEKWSILSPRGQCV